MIFKSGDCIGQGRCWSASPCSSNQDWTLPAVCMGESSSWKIASLLGNNIWTIRLHLITQDVHAVTGSSSTIQSNYETSIIPKYCCPNHHRSASMFHSWKQAFIIIDFLGHSPNIKPARCLGTTWRNILRFPVISRPGFMIITPSLSPFCVFSVIGGLAIAALPRMLDLWNCRRTVFVETWSSRWILSSAVTFAAVVVWFSDTILLNGEPFHLVLVFGHSSS